MNRGQTPHQILGRDLLDSLTKISRKLRTRFNARVMQHGLTYARARTLFRLSEKAPVTQKQLACELELEPTTMGRLLDRMERLDLVMRRDVPGDRRSKQIVLTKHGTAQARLVARIGQEIRDEMFAGISQDDMRRMISLLDAVDSCAGQTAVPDEAD